MTGTAIVMTITWTLAGQPMPPIQINTDLPFGSSTGQTGEACAAAQSAWLDMAMKQLVEGRHNSMGMSFTCVEKVRE
jgi:hypothetical protein